ncbi:hypothetical protein [Microbacterium sp. ZXX196]|uniref:hypothetical protein n=1 Tax=Microbacterium sp. ZXX196 TaxID=2609291 RepID=UPI0012B741D4|nr:hypothetical protein [Microbacterium sp. ZXX196]MTE24859.1 hypothetical protein [Microbacterium sp. ZXX196]
MDISRLQAMTDEEFKRCVSQAVKSRRDHPDWWRALLDPRVIDDTEDAVEEFIEKAELHAGDPERYPKAAWFADKMRGVLAEIALERVVTGDE